MKVVTFRCTLPSLDKPNDHPSAHPQVTVQWLHFAMCFVFLHTVVSKDTCAPKPCGLKPYGWWWCLRIPCTFQGYAGNIYHIYPEKSWTLNKLNKCKGHIVLYMDHLRWFFLPHRLGVQLWVVGKPMGPRTLKAPSAYSRRPAEVLWLCLLYGCLAEISDGYNVGCWASSEKKFGSPKKFFTYKCLRFQRFQRFQEVSNLLREHWEPWELWMVDVGSEKCWSAVRFPLKRPLNATILYVVCFLLYRSFIKYIDIQYMCFFFNIYIDLI